jgi:glycosyltransferase involved in cell wall biosynthesis
VARVTMNLSVTGVEAETGTGPAHDRRQRVCMFVYNSCAPDARVLKEARTLTAAGHDVQIVAVLDKRTTPVTVHPEGFTVIRIDRDPVHYRVLIRTRQLRRRVRLRRARTKRWVRVRSTKIRRAVRHSASSRSLRRLAGSPSPSLRRRLGLAAGLFAFPFRVYRHLRWRTLRRCPPLRRAYYRRRARGRGNQLRHWRYRRRARAALDEQSRQLTETWPELSIAVGAGRRLTAPRISSTRVFPPALLMRVPGWVDHGVSRFGYRTLMLFHKPLMFTSYWMKAYELVRSQQGFDVVHAHDLNTLPVAAVLAARAKCQLVYDAHELYSEISTLRFVEKHVWSVTERALIRRADALITVCESIADEFVKRYGVAKPEVLLNAPVASAMSASVPGDRLREKAGLVDDAEPIILYQGGFIPNRGLEELVMAAPYIERGTIVFMGWGKIEEELRELVVATGVEDRVRIVGPAPQDELLDFTRGADVGVIPYKAVGLNNYYTTPNKLFEYMLAGVAVAGSDVPELRRFVHAHRLGITFDPFDPRDIAMAINYLLGDGDELREMRKRAIEAGRLYVWERQAPKLLSVYRELGEWQHARSAVPQG